MAPPVFVDTGAHYVLADVQDPVSQAIPSPYHRYRRSVTESEGTW
jgi:hypothetical protein